MPHFHVDLDAFFVEVCRPPTTSSSTPRSSGSWRETLSEKRVQVHVENAGAHAIFDAPTYRSSWR